MGMLQDFVSFVKGQTEEVPQSPLWYCDAPIITHKGGRRHNLSNETLRKGFIKLDFKGLSKEKDEFFRNLVYMYQRPWALNPMAILNPLDASLTVRSYVELRVDEWAQAREIHQLMADTYVWKEKNPGKYAKFVFAFYGNWTLEVSRSNDARFQNRPEYVGHVDSIKDFFIIKEDEKKIFQRNPKCWVDPLNPDPTRFDIFKHPNREVNMDVINQMKKLQESGVEIVVEGGGRLEDMDVGGF